MLPALVHIDKIKSATTTNTTTTEETDEDGLKCDGGPHVLILTPHQRTKDDIYAVTKAFIDAANFKCVSVYENEDKSEQVERLSKSKIFASASQ